VFMRRVVGVLFVRTDERRGLVNILVNIV
jgi:hypothetical protein